MYQVDNLAYLLLLGSRDQNLLPFIGTISFSCEHFLNLS